MLTPELTPAWNTVNMISARSSSEEHAVNSFAEHQLDLLQHIFIYTLTLIIGIEGYEFLYRLIGKQTQGSSGNGFIEARSLHEAR